MARKSFSKEPYIFTTLTAFSIAFFMTFILGNILIQISSWTSWPYLNEWGQLMTCLVGPAIGISIAHKSQSSYLGMIGALMAGCIGLGSINGSSLQVAAPFMAYVCVLLTLWVIHMIEGKTPFDLFLIPIVSVLLAGIVRALFAPYLAMGLGWIIGFINDMVVIHPLVMGIAIACVAGLLFTSPITLIAITSILNLSPLASGVALSGVMCFMLGLGIMSLQDNDLGDSIAVLFGSSMLQFVNCLKHPIILIPPLISSIVCGMLSAGLFQVTTTTHAAAMGGTALIGIIETVNYMGMQYWIIPVVTCVILPIIINFFIYQLLRRARYISHGDLRILR